MKTLLLKSTTRKLILLLLLGLRFLEMGGVSFNNVVVHGAAMVAVPLSSTLGSNIDDISAKDDIIFNSEWMVHEGSETYTTSDKQRYRIERNTYNEENPLVKAASQQSSTVIIHSEAGPIETSYNIAFKSGIPNLDDINSGQTYNDDNEKKDDDDVDDVYIKDRYIATTPRIMDSILKESEHRYEDQDDDDDDDEYFSENRKLKAENEQNEDSRNPVNSILGNAKNLWDIFIALNTAWNTIAEQKSTDLQSTQKGYLEDEQRLRRNSYNISTTTTVRSHSNYSLQAYTQKSTPFSVQNLRKDTAVAEGRYIKGDPLKGYYDFVITEGSYKFWAAFQLATAILIIYSTFAAIYYSKVNPLVGDYDYVDYLGGARSISDDDVDFVDTSYNGIGPTLANDSSRNAPPGWISSILHKDWIPKVGHTMKFILEAIDKMPQKS